MEQTTATPETASQANGHGTAKTIEVHNPATGERIASVPALNAKGVAEVVERARAAQPAWQALGFEGRGRILRRAQKWVLDNEERIC